MGHRREPHAQDTPSGSAGWVANCDFTVRGATEDEVADKIARLNAAARRIGIGTGHTDHSGPQEPR